MIPLVVEELDGSDPRQYGLATAAGVRAAGAGRRMMWGRLAATAAVLGALLVAGCSTAADRAADEPGVGAPTGSAREPGTIAPPRKISSRKPTTFVGGPLLFRVPYPEFGTTPFAYVLVFKLNRDPFRNFGIENAERRGSYAAAGVDFTDGGVRMSTGKHCFVAYVIDSVPDPAIAPLHTLHIGALVRVKAQPLRARPRDREYRFDVPLLRAGRDVADATSLRRLRRIGCGRPDL
jgi:hypothetical protein